jgi:hypothetical protein
LIKIKAKQARLIADKLWAHTWAQPLNSFVSVASVMDAIDACTAQSVIQEELVVHIQALNQRFSSLDEIKTLKTSELMSPQMQTTLEQILGQTRPIDEDLLEALMKVDLVSVVLRRLVERILESFVDGVLNREPKALGGVGRSAFGFAARASKGLFDKMSAQIEGPLRQTMAGFVQGSMDRLKHQLSDIIQSEDVQEKFGEARLSVLKYMLNQSVGRGYEIGFTPQEIEQVVAQLPSVVNQIVQQPACRRAVEAELEQLLGEFGDQPISAMISDELKAVIDEAVGKPLAASWTTFFRSKAFANCLETDA